MSETVPETVPEAMREAARGYEQLFVPALFQPWVESVAAAAGIGSGASVVDVACGTGVLARHALALVGSSGRVVGVDPAPGMIHVASEEVPEVDWRLGTAEALAAAGIADASCDHVVSQFGMMFFADRDQAAAEMARVLKPGGTVGVAVWGRIADNPFYGAVAELLQAEVSQAAADAIRLPFCLGNAGEVVGVLTGAGFADVAVATAQRNARFPSFRHLVEAELRGWLPLFDIHLDEAAIATVLQAADERLGAYRTASGEAVFPTTAHVISGRKV